MCKALVIREDKTDDRTHGLPRKGDVVDLFPDDHTFGRAELEQFRVVTLPGPKDEWQHLLGRGGGHVDAALLPLYRHHFLDSLDRVRVRATAPAVAR